MSNSSLPGCAIVALAVVVCGRRPAGPSELPSALGAFAHRPLSSRKLPMAVASCSGFVGLCALCVLRGSGVDDSADDLKEKVPTNNEVCFHGETLPTGNYAELVGTMLGWGNDVAGGKGPSMAQAADRVLRIFGDDLPAVDRTGGLRVRQILAPPSLPPSLPP